MIFVSHQLPVNVPGEPRWTAPPLRSNPASPNDYSSHSRSPTSTNQEYADSMTGDYLKAVAATLNAMRRLAVSKNAVSAWSKPSAARKSTPS